MSRTQSALRERSTLRFPEQGILVRSFPEGTPPSLQEEISELPKGRVFISKLSTEEQDILCIQMEI